MLLPISAPKLLSTALAATAMSFCLMTPALAAGGTKLASPGVAAALPAANANAGGGGGGGGGGSDAPLTGEILVKLRTTEALPDLLRRYPLTLLDRFSRNRRSVSLRATASAARKWSRAACRSPLRSSSSPNAAW